MKTQIRLLSLVLFASGLAVEATAQAKKPAPDLARVSIEDLMNMEITSASRKRQRLGDVPAAVYVITQEDIRRSGMATVPDVLRLAPGVQVAQITANKWAVSVRGFNDAYSNKLLVLVDGRSVYNRLFSGVLWDAEDLVLEDIDRIEVIRGPGGAVWGANAVNGVINIVTLSAADTSGALVRAGGGAFGAAQVAARYGGAIGGLDYRVYSQWTAPGDSLLAPAVTAGDSLRRATVGFRGDWTSGERVLTVGGRATHGRAKALWLNLDPAPVANRAVTVDRATEMNGGMLLARWTQPRRSGASLEIQSTIDIDHRDEPVGDYHRRMGEVDVQYHTRAAGRHDVVAGTGYRVNYERFAGRNGYRLVPEAATVKLFNLFAQDEIAMARNRLHGTLGARVERDDLAGWGVQPTARLTWDLVPQQQHLWAATSRALRTPSLQDRGIRVDYPPVATAGPLPVLARVFGGLDARIEEFADVEAGYRVELGSVATIAVTGFAGRYQHLRTKEPDAPAVIFGPGRPYVSVPVHFGNQLAAKTTGLEIDAHWEPLTWWRVDGSYSAFHLTPTLDPLSGDPTAAHYDGNAPGHQWQLHSSLSIGRAELDATVFRVGQLDQTGVPAYLRADVRVEWKLTDSISAAAIGQNLFDPRHTEFTGASTTTGVTAVPRSARFELTWRVSGS